jgi:hypothetical protein
MSDGMIFGLAVFVFGVATSAGAVVLGRYAGTAVALSAIIVATTLYGIVWVIWPGIASEELRPWTHLGWLGAIVGFLVARWSSGSRT